MSITRKLPVGIQDFEKLRKGGNVYIDKTLYIHKLISTDAPYFLVRPRRFGKSLFFSTLKAYFLGKKELFEGLAIAELEKDWLEYPVFYLDFNVEAYIGIDSLYSTLNANLSYLEEKWGKNPEHDTPSTRFSGLIRRACEKTGRKAVVLIDEYDEYRLGFPDEEVRYGFLCELLPAYVPQYNVEQNFSAASFTRALRSGDIDTFMTNMRAFYGSIACDMTENRDERYFQFVFYLILTLMGQFVQTKVKSVAGRADAVVKTADRIYVFESKMEGAGTAKDALKQIDDKGYLIPYAADGRQLVKVGAEFDREKRTIGRWMVKKVSEC